MRKFMRKLAILMCAILIVNTLPGNFTLKVMAEGEGTTDCTVNFSVSVEGQAANNYNLSITQMESETSPIPGGGGSSISVSSANNYSANQTIQTSSVTKFIRYQVQTAGQTATGASVGGQTLTPEQLAALTGNDGLVLSYSEGISSIAVTVNIQGGSSQNPSQNETQAGDVDININNNNGIVSYKIGDGSWTVIQGTHFTLRAGTELSGIADGTLIYLKADPNEDQTLDTHEGQNRNRYDNTENPINTDALLAGNYSFEYYAAKSYQVQIKFEGGDNSNGGQQNPPQNPETIAVTINDPNHVADEQSGFTLDGRGINNGSVTVEQCSVENPKHRLEFDVAFGKALSKIIVNGTETECNNAEGRFSIDLPDATAYTISLVEGESQNVTIAWAYDKTDAETYFGGADAWVEHGRVELVEVKRGEDVIFTEANPPQHDPNNPFPQISIDERGGYVPIKKGDAVTLRLIPDYGYQLKSATINGQQFAADNNKVSTFKLGNIQGNLHFSAAFEKTEDIKEISPGVNIENLNIENGQNAAASGNLKLTVSNADGYDVDVTSFVNGEGVEKVTSLDFDMKNIVSKGTPGANWEMDVKKFDNPVDINFNIDFALLKEGEEFAVVRDHNEQLEEINTINDFQNGILAFQTDRFSTYTIVRKQAAGPEAGEVFVTFDVDAEKMEVSEKADFSGLKWACAGDMTIAYFAVADQEGKMLPLNLFKNDFELKENVKIQYAQDENSPKRAAEYSIAFGIFDELGDADLRIRPAGDGFCEVSFCRNGIYEFDIDGKVITVNTFEPLLVLQHDQQPNYCFNVYQYEKGDTFTVIPKQEVEQYSIIICPRFGFGVDGNREHYYFTASQNGADVTDRLIYAYEPDMEGYAWGANYKFGNEAVTLKVADFATGNAEVYLKVKTHDDEYVTKYDLKYVLTGVRDDESKKTHINKKDEEPQAFQCFIITKEEYEENCVDYFIDWPLYITYGATVQEAMDVMLDKMEKGQVPSSEYLLIRSKVAVNNKEEVSLSMQPQYISTPDNIKGVVITCQEMDYVCLISNNTAINGGKDFEEWVGHAAPLNNPESKEKYFARVPGGFVELIGSFEQSEFAVKDGNILTLTNENGMEILYVDGVAYEKPENYVIEYQIPELHVDATTEIHLVGSFMENDNDQPSIFLNIPEGSKLRSIINGDVYTSANLGKTITKDSVFHSWYSGDVHNKYTVKVDKLEAKTTFEAGEKSEVTSVTSEVNVDSLFEQLTGANSTLTPEEKALVAAGKNITVTLDVQAVNDTSSQKLKDAIKENYDTENLQYLDIDLLYHVGFDDAPDKNIAETGEKVKISIGLKKEFLEKDAEYVILREHNGVVEELPITIDENCIGTFSSNKFSSYALVKKVADATPTPNGENKNPDNNDQNNSENNQVVKNDDSSSNATVVSPRTGDIGFDLVWLLFVVTSICMLVLVIYKFKEFSKKKSL